jgi:hypothetical protein
MRVRCCSRAVKRLQPSLGWSILHHVSKRAGLSAPSGSQRSSRRDESRLRRAGSSPRLETMLPGKPGENDPIHFTPGEHDVRLEHGECIFYVRGVKRGEVFLGDGVSGPGDVVFALTVGLLWGISRERSDRWKVGVMRFRKDYRGRIRVVYKESLARGEAPTTRMAELVTDVRSGRFDPA